VSTLIIRAEAVHLCIAGTRWGHRPTFSPSGAGEKSPTLAGQHSALDRLVDRLIHEIRAIEKRTSGNKVLVASRCAARAGI
jgi:hypothetical protein